MFCACSFHGNSMNNLLSYFGLIDAKIRASDKDLPVQRVVKTLVTTTKGTRISDLHTSLKYGFCKKLHRYNSKTSQKVRKKMFNWSEVHLYRSNFLQNPYFNTLMTSPILMLWFNILCCFPSAVTKPLFKISCLRTFGVPEKGSCQK